MSTIEHHTDHRSVAVTNPNAQEASPGLANRVEELRRMLERSRRDAQPSLFARTDRILAIAGSVALPAGFVAIFLAWNGAARTPFLFEQIPYLISGGLLGVGLVLAGGLLFFGSWFARLAEQDRLASQELTDALSDLQEAVVEQAHAIAAAAAHPNGAVTAPPGAATAGMPLVATPTGAMAHRPDCSVVATRDDLITVVDPEGYRPCKICEPDLGVGQQDHAA